MVRYMRAHGYTYQHDDIGLLISDVDLRPGGVGKGREDLPPLDFIVRNEMFSVEHFSRISGCGQRSENGRR